MVQVASAENRHAMSGLPDRPVVAISRDHGSGGDIIGAMLAQRLGVPAYDGIILDKIAERLKTEPESLRAIDEGVGEARDLWLYRMVTGVDVSPGTYRRHLVNVILSLSKLGGVIFDRGAHVILSTSAALRVRITGSPEACAERVAADEKIDRETAVRRIEEVNHNHGKFVWDMFESRMNDPTAFDIVVNTDRLTDHENVVEMLISAYRAIGQGNMNGR
ncbi:MAG: cytidylate kinase-like family protein [Alphaproteobacteria bacterium]